MFGPDELLKTLRHRCQVPDAAALCVAFSGGLDSTVLLHALAQLRSGAGFRLRALHVDHGLHADAPQWAQRCLRAAAELGVECQHLPVAVVGQGAWGIEASARKARYAALEAALQPGEYLLTAHHADDQLETMLLAMMRGAGVEGLAAMPPVRRFAQGWLARPLLDFTREMLATWAGEQQLQWLDDPSNQDHDLDRNFLRHRVTPLLRERWPAAALTAARSATHLQAAATSQEQQAAQDAVDAFRGECLRVASLRALPAQRRDTLLRYWLRSHGAQMPSTRKLAAIVQDMLGAAVERQPCVQWGQWQVCRHRGLLYCLPVLPSPPTGALHWQSPRSAPLPVGVGELRLVPAAPTTRGLDIACLDAGLQVMFRRPHHELPAGTNASVPKLKKLLQARGVLPWWRAHVPLLFSGKQLIAVGDFWVASEVLAGEGQPGWRVQWQGRERVLAVDAAAPAEVDALSETGIFGYTVLPS